MMPQPHLWHGTFTALVTPMAPDSSLDLSALSALVDAQIAAGVEGLVACGTTGESATLNEDERFEVIRTVVSCAQGRVPVMAGAGTGATASTISATTLAKEAGAQGALVVTPFYNKPSQAGLQQHFEAVADASPLPVMLYNVPSRTGCDLSTHTLVALSAHPNIFGIKDATGDLGRLDAGLPQTPDSFVWHSGDDNTACAFVLMGGHGVTSVASNLLPKTMGDLIRAATQGDLGRARKLQRMLTPVFAALGQESNPLPIKTALALRGQVKEAFRLPLCAMRAGTRRVLAEAIAAAPSA